MFHFILYIIFSRAIETGSVHTMDGQDGHYIMMYMYVASTEDCGCKKTGTEQVYMQLMIILKHAG